MTKKPVTKAGARNKSMALSSTLELNINNITNVNVHPKPNIIKSMGVKKPKINIDFFELAGIK